VEAQLNTLKTQLQPHFLFNSLNSLSELIESDRARAAEMTQKLADLYREILAASDRILSPLSSEAAIVQKYLELERLRFGERLSFRVVLPPNAERVFLPSLLAQTLVENAVKHGIARSIEGGEVELRVASDATGGYRFELTNTGEPLRAGYRPRTGLTNSKARLDLLYGPEHGLELLSDPSRGTRVSFHFSGEEHYESA
jgi:sensor histidine kinase YesM